MYMYMENQLLVTESSSITHLITLFANQQMRSRSPLPINFEPGLLASFP